jgi:hypothetical protein
MLLLEFLVLKQMYLQLLSAFVVQLSFQDYRQLWNVKLNHMHSGCGSPNHVLFRRDCSHIHINSFHFAPAISRLKAQPLVYRIYLVFENIRKGCVF